jgi:hypothetical protein
MLSFANTGNYLLSFTAINTPNGYSNTSYYCIVLSQPAALADPIFYTSPIPFGGSNSFNTLPFNITTLFNNTISGQTYYVGLYNMPYSDYNYYVNITLSAMYLGNPN